MIRKRKLTPEERAKFNRPKRPRNADGTLAAKPQEDPRKVALTARARIVGVTLATPEARRDVSAPMLGTDIGRCINHLHADRDVQASLWDVWQAVCSARLTYRRRILGQTGTPKGMTMAMVPEPMETDPSAFVDIRTAEERDIAAKRGDAYWAGLIDRLPLPQHKWALRPALDDVEAALWRDAKPTERGVMAVCALVLLSAAHNVA